MNKLFLSLSLMLTLASTSMVANACSGQIKEIHNLKNLSNTVTCGILPDGDVWILSKQTAKYSLFPGQPKDDLEEDLQDIAEMEAESDLVNYISGSKFKKNLVHLKQRDSNGASVSFKKDMSRITKGLVRGVTNLKYIVDDKGVSVIVGVSPASMGMADIFDDLIHRRGESDSSYGNENEGSQRIQTQCYEHPMFQNNSSCN